MVPSRKPKATMGQKIKEQFRLTRSTGKQRVDSGDHSTGESGSLDVSSMDLKTRIMVKALQSVDLNQMEKSMEGVFDKLDIDLVM